MTDAGASKLVEDVVLNSPVVAQLELGSVTLLADDWARLQVGDILTSDNETRRVALRVGGRVIAHGELVLVDERVGVRVTGIKGASSSEKASSKPPKRTGG